MNDLLNGQIPDLRCSDQDIVNLFCYLGTLDLMYNIGVTQGWAMYPHNV